MYLWDDRVIPINHGLALCGEKVNLDLYNLCRHLDYVQRLEVKQQPVINTGILIDAHRADCSR